MESQDSALFSALNQELHFIRRIIFANRLHEPDCTAFSPPENSVLPFASLGRAYCDCWISRNNPEPDPTKGYAIYEKATESLENILFRSRAAAVDYLTEEYGFSRDSKSDRYWENTYLVIEAKAKEVEPPPTSFKIMPKRYGAPSWTGETIHPTREAAIEELTKDKNLHSTHEMADKYWGHTWNIEENKEN
jgi:hypothetical protein